MKLKFILSALAIMLCTLAAAESYDGPRISARVGIGGRPSSALDYFCENTGATGYNLSGIYGDYHGPTKSSGLITAEIDFALASWFSLGLNFGITHFSHDSYNGITGQITKHRKGNALYVLPAGKFNYYNKASLKLYGSFGFGIGKYAGFDNLKSSTSFVNSYGYTVTSESDDTLKFEAQCTPLGIEYGRKIFVFGELGFGTLYNGGRLGVGYRF